jgi:ABC-2 type transport system permease protein
VTGGPVPVLGTTVEPGVVRVPVRHFVRLKLRVTANGLRGETWRIALFVLGVVFAFGFAVCGFFLFSVPGLIDDARSAGVVAALGGGLLVLGWLFLPLVFFGVDESLDPARFALLPLDRRTMVTGLFASALAGLPAISMLIATTGLVLSAGQLGGAGAALAAAVGVVCGLLLCVAVSRSVTSAFATALRSRRARDLAAISLAVVAAMLGPLQLVALSEARNADWDRLVIAARIIGWTPLGAPYTLGQEVVEGRAWAVPVKLLITLATIAVLLWWWSRSLESAMLGATGNAPGRTRDSPAGTPVDQLFPRLLPWLPRTRFGALVSREVHYWWRETRRRASLITFTVVGVFLPVMVGIGSGDLSGARSGPLGVAGGSLIFVGVLAAVSLANQFGFEGNAYAANIVAGVPGRVELHSRVLGFTVYLVPLLAVIAVVVGIVVGAPAGIPALLGTLAAAYGMGLAVVLPVSILGAYALPDTSNPFAISSGAGLTKGLLSFGALLAAGFGTLPVLVAAYLLSDAWTWVGLPVGLTYGLVAYLVGARLAGALLDRRMPELLAAVSPNR